MVDCTSCTKPPIKMGFRGVRTSKFRHVYGQPARKEQCYDNIKITRNAHDCGFCAVNPKFIAIVTEVAGGGSFLVLPLEKYGRLDHHNTYKVTGHTGTVLDIKWNPFNDNLIASASDDASVKIWYIPDGGLTSNLTDCLVELTGHKRRVGFVEWHPTAENILASVGFDYTIVIWHVTKAEVVSVIDCHPDIIYSISFNRDGSLLASTCKDKKLRIIDPRTGNVLQEGNCHTGTKASKVVYLGDTGRLLTTGFARYSDRQFAIWDERDLEKPLAIEVIDSSSGVLFPYYDHDTRTLFLAGKGDGNIRYYEIVDHPPWSYYLGQFLSGAPQRGLGWMPKRGCDVYRCEIARFYKLHTIKGLCEPISMIVPRKSDQFQDDIFPDTVAPTAASTGAEWISGVNRPPVLISLKTGVVVKTHKPVVYPGIEFTNKMTDRNNDMKFAFLSQETVSPDYRAMDGDSSSSERFGGPEESDDEEEESEEPEDDEDSEEEEVDIQDCDDVDDDEEDDGIDDEEDHHHDHMGCYDDCDSGVNTDMSLVTVPPRSPSPSALAPLRRTASTKIIHLINLLQQEASKYDLAREKENKEKWEKTWMNQAVQQRKVAAIVSQLQNTGSTPNLTSPPAVTGKQEQHNMENIKNMQNTQELITFDDFRSGYIKKSLEVERLQLMVALKDKRIKELEAHIDVLTRYKGQ